MTIALYKEIDRLKEVNGELVEALKLTLAIVEIQNGNLYDDINGVQEIARTALLKAGVKND